MPEIWFDLIWFDFTLFLKKFIFVSTDPEGDSVIDKEMG